jgi:two-component system, sensor histidine kinase and response regulator
MTVQQTEILVVEDSRTQLQHLVHILEQGGYAVRAASNGDDAMALLAERKPSLVISDIMMPGMDGYQLCRQIKEHDTFADIPVILVTYLSHTHDVVRGLEAGADNFIMKPYEAEFLLARVRRTLAAAEGEGFCPPSEFPLQIEDQNYCIRSNPRLMLEILLSTYETALQKHERLKAAQEALKSANQELEAFSYSVSHDLRTPLSVISGFSDLLWLDYQEVLDEDGRKQLTMIRQAAQKMDRLIDDLLKLSRVTRSELKRERFDLSAMLRDIAAELRREDPSRQVDCLIQEGMEITGDPSLLRIALENLLRNAWKFTSKKETGRIEAGWSPRPEPVYFVRDNGAGFDMREVDQLFASFRRLHSEVEFPGTGLGLTIVQRIIHRHRGRIWAEGRLDEGATFSFTVGK